jgi:hypothetical protein
LIPYGIGDGLAADAARGSSRRCSLNELEMFMFVITGSGTYYVPGLWIFAACAVLVSGWLLTLAWRRARRKAKIRERDDYLRAQLGLGDEGRVSAPPWSIEELGGECFVVRDANGQALSYVYFNDDPHLREVSKRLTSDEARRIAANIAKLPDLLAKPAQ